VAVNKSKIRKALLRLFIVGIFFVLAFWLGSIAESNETVKSLAIKYGYLGVVVVSVISGVNIVIPIPAIAFLPLFVDVGLNYWIIIFAITIGMSVGDAISYLIGQAGRTFIRTKIFTHLESIRKEYPLAPFFILFLYAAFVPLPNELVIIPLSFLGYKFFRLAPVVIVGNLIFNIITGSGVNSIFEFVKYFF
jgi:membrane protein YqaA with SNARE-associated domain